jgi:metallo-beta-lactamase family protein
LKIKFCGAAASVTGSCHLLTTEKYKILLDCGLYQGNKDTEALNWEPFDFDPADIDFLILSHSHIDHSGRIPLLVKWGFKGDIFCTDATADLLEIMLKDSAYIQEKEAEWQNRKNLRAGRPPVEPLYTMEDAERSLLRVVPVLYDQFYQVAPGLHIVFNDAGHILGSAIIELFVEEKDKVSKIVFTGDLGMKDKPILRDPVIIKKADYLIMEATYGDRVHETTQNSLERLVDIIIKTLRRGGNVIIPSFAVGRTQELIFEINRFYELRPEFKKEMDKVMVYVDSPMATSATEVFRRNAQAFDDETREHILKGNNPLDFKNLEFTRTSEQSRALNMDPAPKIIISASGMCEAGRIKHHLKHNLWNPKASIVFVGYQAEGTLGRSIVNGDKDVSIFGEKIHINAEIHSLEGFSGHADREGLLEWLSGFKEKPKQIFLVHGEREAKENFAKTVKLALGYDCIPVQAISEYILEDGTILTWEEFEDEMTEPMELMRIRERLASIHNDMETILYNTQLAMSGQISSARLNEINNVVLELEKTTLNLGSVVTQEE